MTTPRPLKPNEEGLIEIPVKITSAQYQLLQFASIRYSKPPDALIGKAIESMTDAFLISGAKIPDSLKPSTK
jgi:hypothetical protein